MPRLLRTRWWLVLGLALLNAWIAGYLTDLRNQERPEWEAVGAITYVPRLGEVDDDPVLERLRADLEAALATNEEELGSRNGLFGWEVAAIEADEPSHRLIFVGRSDDPSAAEDIAEELRQRFIDAGYLEAALLGELDTQLDLILEELGTLQQRIDEATAVEPLDPEIELQRTLLTAERDALTGRYASLSAQLLAPPTDDRSVESIEEERDLIQSRLRQVRAELTSLPPPPDADTGDEAPPEESLPTTIDSLQYEQLQVVYQELFLRRLEAQAGGTVQPIRLQPTTLQPIPKGFNQAIGAAVGVVAALFGVVIADRVRDPISPGIELEETTVLQVMPPRPLLISGVRPWYLRSPPNERKAGIQKLRSVVEVLNQDIGATVGISGISVPPQDVHELAADLAVSLAVSGRRVLLVDANLASPSHLVEFGQDQVALSELLRLLTNGDDMRHEIKTLLWESTELIPNLRSLSAGVHQLDAADLLSRREFGALLETAREMFDMVVLSGADASDPSAHVLTQRVEAMILVGTVGQTTTSAVVSTTRALADRRARLLGLVVLSRPPGLLGRVTRFFRGRARRRSQRAARSETSLHLRPLPSASDASSSQTRDRPAVGNGGPDTSA